MRDRCKYCETPYGDDRDENGLPFCECDAAEVNRLRAAIAAKDAEIARLKGIAAHYEDAIHAGKTLMAIVGYLHEANCPANSVGFCHCKFGLARTEFVRAVVELREALKGDA